MLWQFSTLITHARPQQTVVCAIDRECDRWRTVTESVRHKLRYQQLGRIAALGALPASKASKESARFSRSLRASKQGDAVSPANDHYAPKESALA